MLRYKQRRINHVYLIDSVEAYSRKAVAENQLLHSPVMCPCLHYCLPVSPKYSFSYCTSATDERLLRSGGGAQLPCKKLLHALVAAVHRCHYYRRHYYPCHYYPCHYCSAPSILVLGCEYGGYDYCQGKSPMTQAAVKNSACHASKQGFGPEVDFHQCLSQG